MNKLPLLLCLALSGLVPRGTSAAEDNPTAYAALRLVGKELGADHLGRIVAVGGREGVPQPFVWRITLAAKPGGGPTGAREIEVAGGRIVANRPAREAASANVVTIDLKNLNLDSSGAFTTADAESRERRLPFSALNYELRADPTAGNRPTWTVQLLDGDHRPLGTLLLAATDGTLIRATGQLAEGAGSRTSSAVVASNSAEEPPPRLAPPPRRRDAPRRRAENAPRPRVQEETDGGGGGFLERAGRTLDRTPGRVVRAIEETPGHVENGVRRAGARVGVGIQRFFEPDARPPASPE